MEDLPQIFDRKAVFTMPDDETLAKLSPERRARLDACAEQWARLQSAEAELKENINTIDRLGNQLQGFRDELSTRWPKQTFHDLWRATYGRANG